ncbi:hypothetical protein J2X69_005092 [Algoriphagus sp. 4150]|uniref:hypothetical protein n=1 Tax=Algoriphagus sp. 4150 TaxID=2817756 RepID=UPI00285DBBAF|nr:hypothetical protein [Algoriphagus sp. 4150]MDR7132718.1 hypothetical protein [Algoriphagus sp. 4150]
MATGIIADNHITYYLAAEIRKLYPTDINTGFEKVCFLIQDFSLGHINEILRLP